MVCVSLDCPKGVVASVLSTLVFFMALAELFPTCFEKVSWVSWVMPRMVGVLFKGIGWLCIVCIECIESLSFYSLAGNGIVRRSPKSAKNFMSSLAGILRSPARQMRALAIQPLRLHNKDNLPRRFILSNDIVVNN